ncbi:pyridoxamine kinase [Deltaproteobacteria bacterium OttesenSCG-928-M10]|nr:pyridoxamine kinase [Deltaproteobacteria bacterium OttesenSCG-928-M10]
MKNPLPRVAAIHDICGYGRCSLTVAIPVLSTMGFEVCPLPTAILSTHTLFPNFTLLDMTDELPKIIKHWKELNLKFDAIYSGFLGSARQVDIVLGFIRDFTGPDTLVVVDPVMADHGKLYPTMPPEMVDEMKKLVKVSKVVTPNLTEAAFMLDRVTPATISEAEARQWLKDLTDLGPEMAVITSAPMASRPRASTVIGYDRVDDRYWITERPFVPTQYHGTGDIFASVLTGSLLQGDSLPVAMDRSAQFVATTIRATFGYRERELGHHEVLLEKALNTLTVPVKNTAYELLD